MAMAAFRLGAAMGIAAVGGWAAALGNVGVHDSRSGGAFGSSTRVHIAHIGRIDIDLESAGSTGLRRARCAGAPAGIACFVASARR